jgi:hypothetical protein
MMGSFRAVKIIRRSTFDDDRPFEREFLGIRNFEPVSRTHVGLVPVLHVGGNLGDGYFYYIMEVADDVQTGREVKPDIYKPRTLASELARRRRLPVEEGIALGRALCSGLGHLHHTGLVHRDIKPSNIIFIGGVPRFADVGLVSSIHGGTSLVGTPGYIPPEGPGTPTADIFSLGKVLYQVAMGLDVGAFPSLPSAQDDPSIPQLMRLNPILLKACDNNPARRYQSASELDAALASVAQFAGVSPAAPTVAPETTTRVAGEIEKPGPGTSLIGKTFHIALLYKAGVQPDGRLLELLNRELSGCGCDVFIDKHLTIGVPWAREIETKIRGCDAAIVLLSASSVHSEMIAYEVELAHQSAQQQNGKPLLLPVRVMYTGPLPGALGPILEPLQYFLWEGPQDDERLVNELFRALETSQQALPTELRPARLESIGGAVPLASEFYVVRPTDHEFQAAITRRDSIVLVKGARQMGKTSLLARGLQQARQSGARVVLTDFQKLNTRHLASVESFFLTLGDFLADQLDLAVLPEDVWDKRRGANTNFERYLRREVLGKIQTHFVWGLDEVDRLFTCDFGSEVFGLFRSWHNERALDPAGPWSRLTLAIAYATEAHLFITDVNQSPFNVGTRLTLDDFTFDQVADLNERYGSPLKTPADLERFHALLGGQPYLTRRGLNELASGNVTFADFAEHADRDEGIFGDHLRRMLVLLAKDPELSEVVRGILRGQPCSNASFFYRLRSAGLMIGDSPQQVRPRCEIYASYLRGHLQ